MPKQVGLVNIPIGKMKYYRFVQKDRGVNLMMTKQNNRDCHPQGLHLEPKDPIFYFEMHAGEEYGYDQYDPDFEGTPEQLTIEERLNDYYTGDFLCSKRLADTLIAAGADQLELFPVQIEDAATGESLDVEYHFLNPLGSLLRTTVKYQKNGAAILKLDPSEVGDLAIFRPANTFSELVVSQQVAAAIDANRKLLGFRLEELQIGSI